MRVELGKLFGRTEPGKQTCIILGRMFPGRYKLRDRVGRIIQADSDQHWIPGDSVVVQQDRVVGRAAAGEAETVEV